jgi:hypothetical protein
MANLPIVHHDGEDFSPSTAFWPLAERYIGRPLNESEQSQLTWILHNFARGLEAEEKAVSASFSTDRVNAIRTFAESFKDIVSDWRPPIQPVWDETPEERADRTAHSILYVMYSDRLIDRELAKLNLSVFEGASLPDVNEVDGPSCSAVSATEFDKLGERVKPLSVNKMGHILRFLLFACDAALHELEDIQTANHYAEGESWKSMIAGLAEFFQKTTLSRPTAAENEASGYSLSPFVGLVHAVHCQFPKHRTRLPGKPKSPPPADLQDKPANALAKAVRRALNRCKEQRDKAGPRKSG